MKQQHILNRVSLKSNTHKIRVHIDQLIKIQWSEDHRSQACIFSTSHGSVLANSVFLGTLQNIKLLQLMRTDCIYPYRNAVFKSKGVITQGLSRKSNLKTGMVRRWRSFTYYGYAKSKDMYVWAAVWQLCLFCQIRRMCSYLSPKKERMPSIHTYFRE